MDFFTKAAVPISITIDGTAYQLPRFLNRALKTWAAETVKMQKDAAIAQLTTADEKARFEYYFSEPLFDIAGLMARAQSPQGAEYVVQAQMKLAGVPDEQIEAVLANGDPAMIRSLATQLTQADQVRTQLGDDGGNKDPLPGAPDTSGVSPATGQPNTPASPPATET